MNKDTIRIISISLFFALAAGPVFAAWTVDADNGAIHDGEIEITIGPDAAHDGGIVLKKVRQAPKGDWTLDSLPRIEADTGLRPTAIDGSFVAWNSGLRSFALPDTVRSIGRAAFFACENATNAFTQGSRLKRIDTLAFKRCGGLRGTVDFSPCEELERIDPEAFIGCGPERAVFGDSFKRRVADSLRAADATNGYPRASTDWLAGSFGIGVHWTTWTTDQDGQRGDFDKAVDAFDVPRFVAQLKEAGARHIIFTSSWAEQHPPAPCSALDRILPGRTTKRNLLREIADALAAEGIRTILYYNHGCNGEDPEWMKAVGYAEGRLGEFGSNIVSIVHDLSLSAGPNVAGWWFDSPGAVSDAGPHRVASVRIGDYKFPFRELALAAKAGNRDTLVSVNSQGGTFVYTPCQEYFSGEELVDFPLCGRTNAQGMQMHLWLTMDNRDWVHRGSGFAKMRFTDDYLRAWLARHLSDGCAVTLNVDVDRSGLLNPTAIEQLKRDSNRLPQPFKGDYSILITKEEALERYDVGLSWIYKRMKDEGIRTKIIKGKTYFPRKELDRFLPLRKHYNPDEWYDAAELMEREGLTRKYISYFIRRKGITCRRQGWTLLIHKESWDKAKLVRGDIEKNYLTVDQARKLYRIGNKAFSSRTRRPRSRRRSEGTTYGAGMH